MKTLLKWILAVAVIAILALLVNNYLKSSPDRELAGRLPIDPPPGLGDDNADLRKELNLKANDFEQPQPPVQIENTQPSKPVSTQASVTDLESWVVQVGSFSQSKNAMNLINQLKEKEFNVFSKIVLTEQGRMTQVFVGPEINRSLAESLQADLNKTKGLNGVVVAYRPREH